MKSKITKFKYKLIYCFNLLFHFVTTLKIQDISFQKGNILLSQAINDNYRLDCITYETYVET